ncbi:hypothetical protein PR202_gb03298 [Eleusine coracana subsp. coracana]|uniref:Disease resistance RPP13-like protein 1 n=1 Tax=Eleusine coracana subsp. coracana TaxID=191504 RepID=A0AAV5E0V2_ELECO|nr:hypothetical protein PR202_gb03218 [Eleusine coracana subsp. coracana]GJN16322.1 hypothetical protein PR202_gb03298 [Eleusine coracana subsp. coracana]
MVASHEGTGVAALSSDGSMRKASERRLLLLREDHTSAWSLVRHGIPPEFPRIDPQHRFRVAVRNELVRQWVAGGFVGNSPGRDVWDIANSYFNELINRSMIQPAYDDLNGEVLSCFPKLSTILPSQICRVRYLETLELPGKSSCNIPKDIIDLPRLSHLVLPLGTRLPDGIGKLKSLRTLRGFSLSKSSLENTKGISELTNLKELALIISREVYWNTMLVCGDDDDTSESIWMAALSSCLEKLSNLKRLSMESYSVTLCGDALSSFSPSFHKLEDLDLSGWAFSRVPIWIGNLQNLSMLELTSKSTCREDVGIIGMLPSLVQLILRIQGVPKETIEIGATGFSMLKHLLFDCDALSYLTFGVGAMPKLWRLTLGFDEDEWDKATPVGLHNLLSITQIKVFRSNTMTLRSHSQRQSKTSFMGQTKI